MTQIAIADSFLGAAASLDSRGMRHAAIFIQRLAEAGDRSGFNFEMIHDASDRTIRSIRVSKELRAIAHVDGDRILLLYVGHHDTAYEWARNRCVECHPVTGELQVVETPRVVAKPLATATGQADPGLTRPTVQPVFGEYSDEYLLSLGAPPSWLPTLRMVRSDEAFMSIAEGLPEAVAERLLRLAEGELVAPPDPVSAEEERAWRSPLAHRWICEVTDTDSVCELLDGAGIEHGLGRSGT